MNVVLLVVDMIYRVWKTEILEQKQSEYILIVTVIKKGCEQQNEKETQICH